MTTGGDICKAAFASGADAVMSDSAFARAQEAPGRGYQWGMAIPHSNLPRGTRIRVGVAEPLEQILGPAFTEDGTLNLVGAIRTCMGSVGAMNIRELQQTEQDPERLARTAANGAPCELLKLATPLPLATASQRLRRRPGRPRTKPSGDNPGDSREPQRTQVRVPPARQARGRRPLRPVLLPNAGW